MASITDCVVEGLKYPFSDIKKILGFGVLFALMSALSTYIGFKLLDIFRLSVHAVENANTTLKDLFDSVDKILLNFYIDIEELNRQVNIIDEIKKDSIYGVLKNLYELKNFEVKFEGKDFLKTDDLKEEIELENKEKKSLITDKMGGKYKGFFPTEQIKELSI